MPEAFGTLSQSGMLPIDHSAPTSVSVPPMAICSMRVSCSLSVDDFVRRKMTEEASTPTTLSRCASRCVKQPKEYGSNSALDSAVMRVKVVPVQEHTAEVSE